MERTWKRKLLRFLTVTGIVLVSVSAFLYLAMQGYSVGWTGFGKPAEAGTAVQGKTLWDWMDLLLVPLFLAGGALILRRSERDTAHQRFDAQAALQHELATDRQQEQALQSYFDQMADLLQKEKLSITSSEELLNVARVRTLTVLRGLDAKRKGSVLLFLRDSKLIDREAVIDLSGADLRGACLAFAKLKGVNLSEADLSGADLGGANLSKSYMAGTDLRGANLKGANLGGAALFESRLNGADLTRADLSEANLTLADLRGCHLNEADLRGADLSGVNLNVGDLVGADLRKANLGGAKLLGADLSEADLSQADLSGTEITGTELGKAKSLDGTTMPDGSKHD
ncbi:MAG TPA: pentapeptide repeat-containing protein [Anaerolineales bacterium]|nr:pentapeptide repeat-containing protein [Anaerolineales bacterium]